MTTPPQVEVPPPASTGDLTRAAQLAALLLAYRQSTQAVRNQLAAFITALWQSLGYYGTAQQAEFVNRVAPVVLGTQRHMAALTTAFIAQQTATAAGVAFRPAAIDPTRVSGAAVRSGVDPAEVYGRPFHLVWRQLSELPREPGSIDQAIQAGLDRAIQTGLTDLQLAKTHAARQSLHADRYAIGYRRVLEGAHSCGLCIVASTNTYHKRDLMPMHPGCDCGIAPVFVDSDAADAANRRLLGDVHQAIADRFGSSDYAARLVPGAQDGKGRPVNYRDVLVTHDHGELGPVLAVKGRPFTGPAKLDNGKPPKKAGRTPAQVQAELSSLERTLPNLKTDQQRAYMRQRIDTLRQQLG